MAGSEPLKLKTEGSTPSIATKNQKKIKIMIWRILFPVYFMFLDIEEATQCDVIENGHRLFFEHALEHKDEYNAKLLPKLRN